MDGVGDAGELRVRVRAAATDGEANRACLRTLAAAIGVAPSCVTLVRGHRARTKLVAVAGVDRSALEARWPTVKVLGG